LARPNGARRALAATIALAVALACAACSGPFAPPTGPSRSDQVAAAVEAADPRVTEVAVEKSTDGFSSGWAVDVIVEGDAPVTADELSALLLAVRHAGGDPGHVDLYAETAGGRAIDLTAAADDRGLWWSNISTGIAVTRDAIDDTLGADGTTAGDS
jgi:hypothetical protein